MKRDDRLVFEDEYKWTAGELVAHGALHRRMTLNDDLIQSLTVKQIACGCESLPSRFILEGEDRLVDCPVRLREPAEVTAVRKAARGVRRGSKRLLISTMVHDEVADRSRPDEARIIRGAVFYFVLVMIAGFALGTLREMVLVPALGRALGEPLEAPLMFAAIAASAWLATGWCRVPADLGARIAIGSLALALVLIAELALSPLVLGSAEAWFESFTPFTLALSVALWAAQALMPLLVRR